MKAHTDYEEFGRFQKDVSKHTVTVLRDDGLYRHLRCSAGTFNMQFDVVGDVAWVALLRG